MASPFDKRAIEKFRDDPAFLPFIAPEPLALYLKPSAERDVLFDRLVVISGTPGSGKTTLAQLFRVRTLINLANLSAHSEPLGELQLALGECKAYEGVTPRLAGCRLSMEDNYRDCWECPYDENTRHRLLRTLINARAMLAWLQGFLEAGISLEGVRLIGRRGNDGALESIGGESAVTAQARAIAVERAVYRVCASLLPPERDALPADLQEGYAPIDLLDRFEVKLEGQVCEMQPLLILDDVHGLHVEQQKYLRRWLAAREMSVARWMLTRFDAFAPEHVLYEKPLMSAEDEPGIQQNRDITDIRLQRPSDRAKSRNDFRRVARQMSKRYLAQIAVMNTRGATEIDSLLTERLTAITKSQLERAAAIAERAKRQSNLPAEWVRDITDQVTAYLATRAIDGLEAEAVGNAMVGILLSRQAKKTPQTTFFEAEPAEASDDHVVKPNSSVEHGARVHLWHHAKIPYLYGFEDLADLANENTERFLDLANQLVSLLQVRAIRNEVIQLPPPQQFSVLHDYAKSMVANWNFPESTSIKHLAAGIARECVAKSLEPNASLGGGASAFGIPMEEYLKIAKDQPALARVLQFGSAYNVFSLIPNHRTKNRDWCLVELCGPVLISHGLTLQRGGFLERRVADLERILASEAQS